MPAIQEVLIPLPTMAFLARMTRTSRVLVGVLCLVAVLLLPVLVTVGRVLLNP